MQYRHLSVPLTLDRVQDMYWRIDMAFDGVQVLRKQVRELQEQVKELNGLGEWLSEIKELGDAK